MTSRERFVKPDSERGMALIGVMLIMSLMLMLALSVTFTALSDHAITGNFRNTTAGFYAAEAGVHNLHRLIRSKDFIVQSMPAQPRVTPGEPTLNPENFIPAAEALLSKREYFPNHSAYRTKVKITDIQVPYPAWDNNPAHAKRRVTYVSPAFPSYGQVEPYSVSYTLESVGEGIAGLNGLVTLVEEGIVNFKLLATASAGGLRSGSFAEFALYLDHFDPYNPEGPFIYQGLGPGDRFSGRVHTNERFGFWTGADGSDPPVFRGYVTQVYREASYYRHGAGQPPPPVDRNSDTVGGVVVAPQFLAGFDRGVNAIPPPANAFDQARAVLDSGFGLSGEAPTIDELRQALRAADQLSSPLTPPKDDQSGKEGGKPPSDQLKAGVYIPTDGESFIGGGIYVVGDADEVVLIAGPEGNRQTMRITQGRQTTTVVIDIDTGTTTIDSGRGTRTLRGIPMDKTLGQTGRPAVSLYVNGSIKSLRGPGRDSNSQPIPAIDSDVAITVTADARAQGDGGPVKNADITVRGDITYETPVVDAGGNPVSGARNVLGIFANGGNINVPVDGTAPDNLTVHASMAAFEQQDSQGNVVTGPGGQSYGGQVRSDLTNWSRTPHRGNFTLVGGLQMSKYGNFAVYDGRMHGYTYKGVWDPRLGDNLAPYVYPGYYTKDLNPEGGSQVTVRSNSPLVLSYKRVYYGSLPPK